MYALVTDMFDPLELWLRICVMFFLRIVGHSILLHIWYPRISWNILLHLPMIWRQLLILRDHGCTSPCYGGYSAVSFTSENYLFRRRAQEKVKIYNVVSSLIYCFNHDTIPDNLASSTKAWEVHYVFEWFIQQFLGKSSRRKRNVSPLW